MSADDDTIEGLAMITFDLLALRPTPMSGDYRLQSLPMNRLAR